MIMYRTIVTLANTHPSTRTNPTPHKEPLKQQPRCKRSNSNHEAPTNEGQETWLANAIRTKVIMWATEHCRAAPQFTEAFWKLGTSHRYLIEARNRATRFTNSTCERLGGISAHMSPHKVACNVYVPYWPLAAFVSNRVATLTSHICIRRILL